MTKPNFVVIGLTFMIVMLMKPDCFVFGTPIASANNVDDGESVLRPTRLSLSIDHLNSENVEQFEAQVDELFESFKQTFGKQYSAKAIESQRRKVFAENVKYAVNHNNRAEGFSSYRLGVTPFADLTNEEYRTKLVYHQQQQQQKVAAAADSESKPQVDAGDLPQSVDWVARGAVTRVRGEDLCGSTWAFSAVWALEGAWFIKTNQLIELSVQQVMDCDKQSNSCEGGFMTYAYEYMMNSTGICSEASYPYKGEDEPVCKPCGPVAFVKNFTNVEPNELALKAAVALTPVAVALDMSSTDFQMYTSGVFTGQCDSVLDHALTAVGYGELNGVKYWKVFIVSTKITKGEKINFFFFMCRCLFSFKRVFFFLNFSPFLLF